MAGLKKDQGFTQPLINSSKRIISRAGFTLVELMIATALLGVIMMSAISIYVAAQRFFNDLVDSNAKMSSAIAVETILRKAQIANTIVYDAANNQIKLRLDTNAAGVPNRTPDTFANSGDDTWFKYSIIGTSLRWRTDTTQATDVSGGDPELVANLVMRPGSTFSLANPSGVATATVLNINFVTQTGTPPTDATLTTSVTIGALPKR